MKNCTHLTGERHHRAKLTNDEVETLRRLHADGWGYRRLARKFEVSRAHVRDIILGRRRPAG